MTSFLDVIVRAIAPALLLVLLGYGIRKYIIHRESKNREIYRETKQGLKEATTAPIISSFLLNITTPALVITSLSHSSISRQSISSIALAALLIVTLQLFLAFFVFRKKRVAILPAVFGNTAYLGYPLALLAFNDLGLSLAIMFDLISALLLFSLGILIISEKTSFPNSLLHMVKVPLFPAALIGLLLNVTNTTIPPSLFTVLNLLGKITIPLVLLLLGYRFAGIHVKNISLPLLISCFKIGVGFALALGITLLLKITDIPQAVILLQAMMPSAILTLLLTEKYQDKPHVEMVASSIILSTVLSFVLLPFFFYFFA